MAHTSHWQDQGCMQRKDAKHFRKLVEDVKCSIWIKPLGNGVVQVFLKFAKRRAR